jgi:metalloprotein, YbeY/UPF0054 family
MIRINTIFNNKDWKLHLSNPNNFIQKKIDKINKKFKKYEDKVIFCTLLLSGDSEIKKLNKKFRKKNKITDVLSFPFYTKKDLKIKFKKEKEIYLGDIIVNLNKVKNKNNKKKFKLEFNKTWIHGLVHLFGYNHKRNKDFYEMSKVEKKFLSLIE